MSHSLLNILPQFSSSLGNDLYTLVFLVFALALSFIWHDFLLVMIHKIREMVLSKDLRTFEAENANAGFRMRIVLAATHLAGVSIFLYHVLVQFGILDIAYWWVFLLLFLLHTFRIVITRILAVVFSMVEMYQVWIESYTWIHYMLGLLLFPLAVLMTYSASLTFEVCANLALICYILSKILLFYRLTIVFYNGIHSLFYLFLYLCTLEIIPLLIVFHYVM